MDDHDVVVDREVHHYEKRRGPGFMAGILFAIAALVAGVIIYLFISDDDDDGKVDINVPSVEVDDGSVTVTE